MSPEWQAILTAADQEGRVVVYSSTTPGTNERITKAFQALYPKIKVEFVIQRGAQAAATLETERAARSDGGDIILGTQQPLIQGLGKSGGLIALKGPNFESWPSEYRISEFLPVLMVEPFLLAYNKNLVTTPPKTPQDLLLPEYDGQLAIVPVTNETYQGFAGWVEQHYGREYFEKMAKLSPNIVESATPAVQSVAAGENLATIWATSSNVADLLAQGAPIGTVQPEPYFGYQFSGGVLEWARRPAAAQVMMNFLMSTEGQRAWVGDYQQGASPLSVEGSLKIGAIDIFDSPDYPPARLADIVAMYNSIFGT